MSQANEGREFEKQVRAVARAIWRAPGEGAPITIDGRERDCIFFGEDLIHYIECTIARSPQKVRDDARKMVSFRERQMRTGKLVKLWIVTMHEPGADQRDEAKKNGIEIMSLVQFQRHIFDADHYIQARLNYPFGSATDPGDDSSDLRRVTYQPTAIRNSQGKSMDVKSLVEMLRTEGQIICVAGDYGVGKSLLVREVFQRAVSDFRQTRSLPVPIAINLRDHWGQDDPHEVLHRHATKLGLQTKDQLVRAFNAGHLLLLLDGFDEITAKPVALRQDLKAIRHYATRVIREFINHSRGRTGVLITGREQFFDSQVERLTALGLRTNDTLATLAEFSDEEAQEFLGRHGVGGRLPPWLPRRPLLLASLVARGVLSNLIDGKIGGLGEADNRDLRKGSSNPQAAIGRSYYPSAP